ATKRNQPMARKRTQHFTDRPATAAVCLGQVSLAHSGRARSGSSLDRIRLEVFRSALVAAADEMSLALQRAAYSTNIKTPPRLLLRHLRSLRPRDRPVLHAAGAPRDARPFRPARRRDLRTRSAAAR